MGLGDELIIFCSKNRGQCPMVLTLDRCHDEVEHNLNEVRSLAQGS